MSDVESSPVDMAAVESFELDHTKVRAPYVRKIAVEHGPKGDAVTNYDIRLDGVIDISPFGCRTGFHLIVWGEPGPAEVAAAIKSSLADIAERLTWEDVPGTDAVSCGNYRDHSLHSAREWSRLVLDQGISIDPFDRSVIA